MNLLVTLSLVLVASSLASAASEQQRAPSRIQAGARLPSARAIEKESAISGLAGNFGQRGVSETSNTENKLSEINKPLSASSATSSDKQQAAGSSQSTSASWQLLSAVEAPTASLIASSAKRATRSSDLAPASSEDSQTLIAQSDFLRSSSGTKGGRQQSSKTRQQSYYQPPQGKTSNYQSGKTSTNWYKPPRPAPIVQQQYEQQSEQYNEQQQVESAPPGQAEPFAFDFNTQDDSGNGQYRKEASDNNGVVRGSYGFRDASGIYRHVEYVADQNGFRANIKSNEPGVDGGPKSQPASIKLDGGSGPAESQRSIDSGSNNDNGDWNPSSSNANLAIASPEFESNHKAKARS